MSFLLLFHLSLSLSLSVSILDGGHFFEGLTVLTKYPSSIYFTSLSLALSLCIERSWFTVCAETNVNRSSDCTQHQTAYRRLRIHVCTCTSQAYSDACVWKHAEFARINYIQRERERESDRERE